MFVSVRPMELLAAGIPLTLLIDLAFGVTSETIDRVSASPELAGTRTHSSYADAQANSDLVAAALLRYAGIHGVDNGTDRGAKMETVLM
jgi:hypothetical protein